MTRLPLLPVLALLVAACNAAPSAPTPAPSSSAPTPTPAATAEPTAAPQTPHVAVDWDVPSSWEPFHAADVDRDAIYKVRPAAGDTEPALVAARTDGAVEAILERWKNLAHPAGPDAVVRSERSTPGFTVISVEIHGAAGLLGAVVLSPARAGLEQTLAREQKQLAELQGKLTDQHPDVKAVAARVEALRQRIVRGDEEGEGPMTLELRGPDKTVTAAREDWKRAVQSFRLR